MEEKPVSRKKKIVILTTVISIAVAILIGVGYATTFSGTSSNSDNSLGTTSLSLTQGGAGAYTASFLDSVYMNTVNTDALTTTYTPIYTHYLDNGSLLSGVGNNLACISKPLTLTVHPNDNSQTSATITVTVTDFTPSDGVTYTMVFEKGGVAQSATYNAGWTFNVTINADSDTTFNVYLFISGSINSPGSTFGFTNHTVDPAVTGSVFTFMISVTA